MASAAGAPPPPPPRGSSHLEGLPAELLLMIYRFTDFDSFINLTLAIYPILRSHNLAPELSSATLAHILDRPSARRVPTANTPTVPRLPSELWLLVVQYLEPADTMSLVFALGRRFIRIPNRDTRERLRIWSRRSKGK
jgi:hypothetical protein